MTEISYAQVDNWFQYHAPTPAQVVQYNLIREAAKAFALVAIANSPPSADQTAAVRMLRQTVMQFNAAIACGGK